MQANTLHTFQCASIALIRNGSCFTFNDLFCGTHNTHSSKAVARVPPHISHLEKQGVAGALVRGLLDALDVGHRQVVPDRLHLVRHAARVVDPPRPVVLNGVSMSSVDVDKGSYIRECSCSTRRRYINIYVYGVLQVHIYYIPAKGPSPRVGMKSSVSKHGQHHGRIRIENKGYCSCIYAPATQQGHAYMHEDGRAQATPHDKTRQHRKTKKGLSEAF